MTRWTLNVISPLSNDAVRKIHSITSSAATSRACCTVRPSTLAVFSLITSSCLVGLLDRQVSWLCDDAAQGPSLTGWGEHAQTIPNVGSLLSACAGGHTRPLPLW